MNREVNVLLPNGNVLMCSQDFSARHVIGNLLVDQPAALTNSAEMKRVAMAMAYDGEDILCRHCHFALEDGSHVDQS
jgi:radical SAM protein with 4Fe4S-binding SPASM domain